MAAKNFKDIPLDAFGPPPGEKTYPCKNCGRQFVKDSLGKHESICKKMTKKQRKVFESGKQRATGSDVTINGVKQAMKEKEKSGGTFARPKTHWRERHEQFIEAVSASKQVDYALKTGTPLPPPPKSMVPSDYVKCEFCGRNFNRTAAERHVPFCKEQNGRNKAIVAPQKKPPPGGGPMKPKNGLTPLPGRGGPSAMQASATGNKSRAPTRDTRRASSGGGGARDPRAPSRGRTSSGGQGANKQRSGLPQPVRRSNSAPKTPNAGQRAGKPPGTAKKPATSRGKSPQTRAGNRPSATRQSSRK